MNQFACYDRPRVRSASELAKNRFAARKPPAKADGENPGHDTVPCPVGLRSFDPNDSLRRVNNSTSDSVASGHTDEALRDMPADSFSTTGATDAADRRTLATTSISLSTNVDGKNKGNVGYSVVPGADWFSWLWREDRGRSKVRLPETKSDISCHSLGEGPYKEIEGVVWQELVNATDTLAKKYNEQLSDLDEEGSEARSVSDETIREVNDAIAKFRGHAARLGMNERELMAAVKGDDPSFQTSLATNETSKLKKDFVVRATDRFVDMFDFYFTQENADASSK